METPVIRVLGVDIGLSWASTGVSRLEFKREGGWTAAIVGNQVWPNQQCTPGALAQWIHEYACRHKISAVSLDGPQGWRAPDAGNRRGVGRWCEYQTRTPGKSGTYGVSYPGTWLRYVQFSIDTFAALRALPLVSTANVAGSSRGSLPVLDGGYHLLEAFPTHGWRTSGLPPLPGHAAAGAGVVTNFAERLCSRYGLPDGALTTNHDDLQAIVCALPAAGLLGGPAIPISFGFPYRPVAGPPAHAVEGLIWCSAPVLDESSIFGGSGAVPATSPRTPRPGADGSSARVDRPSDAGVQVTPTSQSDDVMVEAPYLLDDRDDEEARRLSRGVRLFRHLSASATNGHPIGVGYADFVARVFGVHRFDQVAGRPWRNHLDVPFVLALAATVTEAAGGRIQVRRGETTINAGMDTFIWRKDPPHARSENAWAPGSPFLPPYTQDEWRRVFPDGERRLLVGGFL